MQEIQKAKMIFESDLPQNAKTIGAFSALFGANNEDIIHNMVKVISNDETGEHEIKYPKMKKPRGLTKTESVLHNMLIENTGCHMLDSGGIYGRMWEHNRSIIDFRKLPNITVDIFGSYTPGEMPCLTRNIFPFLVDHLEYDKEMNMKFKRFANKKDNKDAGWLALMEEFAEKMQDDTYPERSFVENTYNHEENLSQTLQYAGFGYDGINYIILQIHNGADVRGGYTEPKIFKTLDDIDTFLQDQQSISANCKCINTYSDDCGIHWYGDEENKEYSLPIIWHWSNRLKGVYCQECKELVNFD